MTNTVVQLALMWIGTVCDDAAAAAAADANADVDADGVSFPFRSFIVITSDEKTTLAKSDEIGASHEWGKRRRRRRRPAQDDDSTRAVSVMSGPCFRGNYGLQLRIG